MNHPEISVVLAAFNCGELLAKTLESVLNQEGPRFELIVVNDGSNDATTSTIDSTLKNAPLTTVITNEKNEGLTKSLIRGCGRAVGDYIARIDAGDRFLPERLERQYRLLESLPNVGLVSCGTRFLSAEGELLYEVRQESDALADGLSNCEIESVCGPSHHGSTMFRRDIYESIGGYRATFPVAQDLDLWLRMAEVCEVRAMPEILYEASIRPDSIGMGQRNHQFETARVILEGAKLRRHGQAEPSYDALLNHLPENGALTPPQACARYEYFVAGCLADRDRDAALRHYREAWRCVPWSPRYALKYWMTRLL